MLKDAGKRSRSYPTVQRDNHRCAALGMAELAVRTASVDLYEAGPLERSLESGSRDLGEAPGHAGMRMLIGRTMGGVGAGSSSK
jgi:hypothetical protein